MKWQVGAVGIELGGLFTTTVNHPLFLWPFLSLKFEHQSFLLNRRNTNEHYSDLHLLHNIDLTLNVQVKFKRKLMWSFVTTRAIKV